MVTKIPSFEKAKIILKTLLKYKHISGNEEELLNRITSIYDDISNNTKRKGRVTNPDIVDYIKIMYGFTISLPMIFYVRKDLGIVVKREDARTVDANKVNRIPSKEQYDAIVDAMKHFKLI